MRLLFHLLVLLFVAGIGAQRARTSPGEASTSETSTRRSRGRVKFTAPSDISEADLIDAAAAADRPQESARKPDKRISRPSSNKPYEVKEVLDDIPNLNARKIHKPRVITETRFEAANAPKKPLYVPLPLPEDEILPEDLLANFHTNKASTEKALDTTPKETSVVEVVSQTTFLQSDASTEQILPLTTNVGQSPELTTFSEQPSSTENEIKKAETSPSDIKKKQTDPVQIVTPVSDLRKVTRVQSRPRVPTPTSDDANTPKARARTRPARRQNSDSTDTSSIGTVTRTRTRTRQETKATEDVSSTKPLRARPIRRRLDSAEVTETGARGRVPSLFSAENTQEGPSKSRTGRKVNYPTVSENENIQHSDRRSSFRRRPVHVKDRAIDSIETTTKDVDTQINKDSSRSARRTSSRNLSRGNRGRIAEPNSQSTEEPSTTTSNPIRRASISRGRKAGKNIEKRIVETAESTKVEKQVDNTNKNEVIKPKLSRTRSHSAERLEVKVDSTEFARPRSKQKPKEIEISTTTTIAPPTRTRRIEHQSRNKPEVQSESKVEEKIVTTTQNTIQAENRRNTIRSRVDSRRSKPSEETIPVPEALVSRNDNRRRGVLRKTNTIEPPIKETGSEPGETFRSVRPRTRYIPPIIDEQKLEVLPLFESEVKTVAPIRKRPNSSRESLNVASSSEHQTKIGTSNEIQSDAPRTRVEIKTERSEKIVKTSKPVIKESVETKVSEVVTKRKIGRQVVRKVKVNKTNNLNNNTEKPNETTEKSVKAAVPIRGQKRVELKDKNKSQLTSSSEEEIGDSDNYPEPFKALIQAKLAKQSNTNVKGSRSQKTSSDDTIAKSTERIVTSSRAIPIVSTTTTARTTKSTITTPQITSSKVNDDDNELVPHSSTAGISRPTRRRFSLTTKLPETEDANSRYTKRPSYSAGKVIRSTVSPAHVSIVTEVSSNVKKQSRYHARFSAARKNEKELGRPNGKDADKPGDKDVDEVSSTPRGKSYSPKPPRGLYSLRNGNKKRTGKVEPPAPAQQQVSNGAKKASRYSSRYRSDIFSRGGSTRPTSAPAYIPTVPTVTTPSDYDWSEGYQWSFNRIN